MALSRIINVLRDSPRWQRSQHGGLAREILHLKVIERNPRSANVHCLETSDRFTFGEITAERAADDNAFVITSLGSQPDADQTFAAIQAAMQFGMIRLRVTPQSKPTLDALTGDGRIKCARTIGTEQPELGVMGIRRT
jgi:hypothetical protein